MNKSNRKKIVVFNEGPVSASSVMQSLKSSFRNTHIEQTNSNALKHNKAVLNENTMAFILPGITGEHSPYKSLLGREGNQRIRQYVEEGGVFIGFCAGAYYACESISYKTPWGITKSQRPGLNFFKATAQGPLPHKGMEALENDRWSDVSVINIEYQDKNDNTRKAGICYGNGPALTSIQDDNIEVLARYTKVPGKPVAMASRKVGKGLALFIGVHPEISSTHVKADRISENLHHVKRLLAQLSPHEHERTIFWNHITDIIKNHNIELGITEESLLKQRP